MSRARFGRTAATQAQDGQHSDGAHRENWNLLRQLEDPGLREKLRALPSILRKKAQMGRMSRDQRLQKMQTALAIALLTSVPMRLQNLVGLRLDRQLQWPNGRTGPLYVVLNDSETKNAEPLEFEVLGEAKALLHEYLDRFRIYAGAEESPWLFVQRGGAPVSDATLRDRISKAIQRELNIKMTPHQFTWPPRSFSTLIPAHWAVCDLLGHRSLKSTTNFYAGMRANAPSRPGVRQDPRRRPRCTGLGALAMPRRIGLPSGEWPQVDHDLWERAITATDFFDACATASHWRPSTRKQAGFAYGRWLAFVKAKPKTPLQIHQHCVQHPAGWSATRDSCKGVSRTWAWQPSSSTCCWPCAQSHHRKMDPARGPPGSVSEARAAAWTSAARWSIPGSSSTLVWI